MRVDALLFDGLGSEFIEFLGNLPRVRWLGLAWFGLVWLGLAWFGLVWFGLAWFGLVWLGLAQFGLVWLGLAWFGLVWSSCFSFRRFPGFRRFHLFVGGLQGSIVSIFVGRCPGLDRFGFVWEVSEV